MSQYEDRLKDYVDVKERIRLFYEKHPDGRLITWRVRVTTKPDGVPRVWVNAKAYRSPDDHHPASGWSWMVLPGATNFTRGSELENTETSAWGRAIGALGIGIDKAIATANEIANKEGQTPAQINKAERERLASKVTNGDGSLIGTAELAKDFPDFLPKQTPDGMVLAFKLTSPDGGIKVIATGALAEVLPTVRDDVIGQRVSCWGRVRDETFTPKGTKKAVTYQVLDLDRIKTPEWTLPAPLAPVEDDPIAEPPDNVVLFGETV